MITYFDTSSIVKWLFEESYSELAGIARDRAEFAVTSLIAYSEALSAIRRARQENRCSESEMVYAREQFLEIWGDFTWIPPSEGIILDTQSLIFLHGLRAYDAIHPASALVLKREAESEVFFSCFDRKLNSAAADEGLQIHE